MSSRIPRGDFSYITLALLASKKLRKPKRNSNSLYFIFLVGGVLLFGETIAPPGREFRPEFAQKFPL